MAFSVHPLPLEVKAETDVAVEPGSQWTTQDHGSGTIMRDWSETNIMNMNIATTPIETSAWNPSATVTTVLKSDPDTQADGVHNDSIKVEPIDDYLISNMGFQFHSADGEGERFEVNTDFQTKHSTANIHRTVMNINPLSVNVGNDAIKVEPVTEIISSHMKTEPVPVNMDTDVQTESVIMDSDIHIEREPGTMDSNAQSKTMPGPMDSGAQRERVPGTMCSDVHRKAVSLPGTMDNNVQSKAVPENMDSHVQSKVVPGTMDNDVQRGGVLGTMDRDAQREVTNNIMTVTNGAVRLEPDFSEDEHHDSTPGNPQVMALPWPVADPLLSPPSTSSYICQCCSASFVLFSSLELHMVSCHGETLFPTFPAPRHCQRAYHAKGENAHGVAGAEKRKVDSYDNKGLKENRKASEKPFTCDICGKGYSHAEIACSEMAFSVHPLLLEAKAETDVAVEPGSQWTTQDHGSGAIMCDWSETHVLNMNTTTIPIETNPWNPSATATAVLKSEPDTQKDSVPSIKVEPIDDYMTNKMGIQFHSADGEGERFEVNADFQTNSSAANINRTVMTVQPISVNISCDVIKVEPVTESISIDTQSEPVPVNMDSDAQTEAVTTDCDVQSETEPVTMDSYIQSERVPGTMDSGVQRGVPGTMDRDIQRKRVSGIMDNDVQRKRVPGTMDSDVQGDAVPETMYSDVQGGVVPGTVDNDGQREGVPGTMDSDAQREAINNIMTVTNGAVRLEPDFSEDEHHDSTPGNPQMVDLPWPVADPLLSPPSTSSYICQCCSASFVLFSSLELHMVYCHGETLFSTFPAPRHCRRAYHAKGENAHGVAGAEKRKVDSYDPKGRNLTSVHTAQLPSPELGV
ncbi:hypothetical protein ACOMHN_023841 [Nucella lapillus]